MTVDPVEMVAQAVAAGVTAGLVASKKVQTTFQAFKERLDAVEETVGGLVKGQRRTERRWLWAAGLVKGLRSRLPARVRGE